MIPYIHANVWHVGLVTIQVWGLFVALGVLAGAAVNAWAGEKRGLEPRVLWDLAVWVVVGSFLGARLAYVTFYDPSYFLAHPWEILSFWEGGLSLFGGFLGAILTTLWFLRNEHIEQVWSYIETAVLGLPIGLAIGRIGCFLIHDHPGIRTSFFLGVSYPDGVIRHDLGLYESLVGFFLASIFALMWWRKAPSEAYIPVFLLLYGPIRFALDFLRIADTRYAGLTPGQYAAVLMTAAGVWLWLRRVHSKNLSDKN